MNNRPPRTLTVHIGSHKTGTTSLQSVLFRVGDLLAQRNMSCFHAQLPSRDSLPGSINSWFANYEGDLKDGLTIYDKPLLARLMSESPGDVIVSSEQFSYVFQRSEIEAFRRELDPYFSSIRIVVYLRRQDRQLASHHQQSAFRHHQYSHRLFGNETVALPAHQPHFGLYLDYFRRVSDWVAVFGRDNMIVRDYDALSGGDVVADFFNTLGIDIPVPPARRLNESKGLAMAKVGLLCNRLRLDRDHPLSRLLQRSFPGRTKMLPAAADARAFVERYRESNRALNEMFQLSHHDALFDDDFSGYPEERQDLWNEERANQAILEMLSGLCATYGRINPGLIFEAAAQLEQSNPALSLELVRIVSHIVGRHSAVDAKLLELGRRHE